MLASVVLAASVASVVLAASVALAAEREHHRSFAIVVEQAVQLDPLS